MGRRPSERSFLVSDRNWLRDTDCAAGLAAREVPMFHHSTLRAKLGLLASIVGFAFAAAPAQATTINLPAGSTATVTGAYLSACNSLSYGYNLDGVDHGLGYSSGGCFGQY